MIATNILNVLTEEFGMIMLVVGAEQRIEFASCGSKVFQSTVEAEISY